MASLLAAGQSDESAAAGNDVESDRRKRRRRGCKGKKGKKGKKGMSGPSGHQGPGGPAGPAGPVESVREQGDVVTANPAQGGAGRVATSVATCATSSVLLGCGYEVSTGSPEDLRALNNTIADVVPDVDARTCTATLIRTDFSNGQVQVAPRVQAFAVCRA